jgi:hypothetical protein
MSVVTAIARKNKRRRGRHVGNICASHASLFNLKNTTRTPCYDKKEKKKTLNKSANVQHDEVKGKEGLRAFLLLARCQNLHGWKYRTSNYEFVPSGEQFLHPNTSADNTASCRPSRGEIGSYLRVQMFPYIFLPAVRIEKVLRRAIVIGLAEPLRDSTPHRNQQSSDRG